MLVASLPLVLATIWCAWLALQRRIWAAKSSRDLAELHVLEPRTPIFEREETGASDRNFQRERSVEQDKIDVLRSVEATAQANGMVTLISSLTNSQAQYVALVEEAGRHDHLARFADAVLERLRAAGLLITTYYVLHAQLVRDVAGRSQPMRDIAARHNGERLLVFGPGEAVVDPISGAIARPLDRDMGWKSRALLATFPVDPVTERKFLRSGFAIASATPGGMRKLGQHLASGAGGEAKVLARIPAVRDVPLEIATSGKTQTVSGNQFSWKDFLSASVMLGRNLGARTVKIFRFVIPKTWYAQILAAAATIIAAVTVFNYIDNVITFWDDDAERGALAVAQDTFGDKATKIVYLDDKVTGQNWAPKDSLWFDNITQGSDLLPYDFFLVLRQANGKLFRDNENMNNRYRYLVRKPTFNNPDGLPIGMVKDNYQGRNFMGFTCSACHTGQINYNGTGIRIDGAPAMSDMDTFLTDLGTALRRAQTPGPVHDAFIRDVLALKRDYSSADAVAKDLDQYAMRLTAYRVINKSDTHYGFARLDALGRIYNQVLEYVANVQDVETVLAELVQEGRISEADIDKDGDGSIKAVLKELDKKPVLNGADRDKLMARLTTNLSLKQMLYFRNRMFNAPNAPVSYPFLWDTPQSDYLQWNGSAPVAGLGALTRNTSEAIGTFATIDWSRSDHWTLAGVFSGQGLFNSNPINFSSSVDVHNLALIEDKLKSLHSPVWPQDILPKLDPAKIARGGVVFEKYCAACHANINRWSPSRRVVAQISAQTTVGTDVQSAVNNAAYTGHTGMLRNDYVSIGPYNVFLTNQSSVMPLMTTAASGVIATPDSDKWWFPRFAEWAYDTTLALRYNSTPPTVKLGTYSADTPNEPLNSNMSYKARSLNGIWATAPYLHNGSVPNLYSLLLPTPKPGDPPGMTYRPTAFMVGSREFDPVNVGLRTDGYAGFRFLTSQLGNSNAGHEYGTRDAKDDGGNVIKDKDGNVAYPALTEQQRWDLVEYLKSL
jgi:mono/diheme cytochrome c family protein